MVKKAALLFLILCSPLVAFAKEPTNLAIIKHQLVEYYDSGEYMHDIAQTVREATHYLQSRLSQAMTSGKKAAIVLDIDETSLSNYAGMYKLDFGGTNEQFMQEQDKGTDPAIIPVLKFYRFAKAHHVAVFFITGRFEPERAVTISNLQNAGYTDWDGLMMRTAEYTKVPAAIYKSAMRRRIEAQGYDIWLSLGDQKSDLVGGYADKGFKISNPYYFIP